jgi:hypothetical protein
MAAKKTYFWCGGMDVIEEPAFHRFQPVLRFTIPEIVVYGIGVIGFLGDQWTTRMALNLPWIVEANSLVAGLMTRGLWLPLDMCLLALSISAHLTLQLAFKARSSWMTLSPPLIYGLVKLSTAMWNMLLIFG